MREPSTAAREKCRAFALRSSARRASCNRGHTPASIHSARRRQQVIPELKPSSRGRCPQAIPVCRTNRVPWNTSRSGCHLRPGDKFGARPWAAAARSPPPIRHRHTTTSTEPLHTPGSTAPERSNHLEDHFVRSPSDPPPARQRPRSPKPAGRRQYLAALGVPAFGVGFSRRGSRRPAPPLRIRGPPSAPRPAPDIGDDAHGGVLAHHSTHRTPPGSLTARSRSPTAPRLPTAAFRPQTKWTPPAPQPDARYGGHPSRTPPAACRRTHLAGPLGEAASTAVTAQLAQAPDAWLTCASPAPSPTSGSAAGPPGRLHPEEP